MLGHYSHSRVIQAGVNSIYGGGVPPTGAVFVKLTDLSTPPLHTDKWFEVAPPWDSQALAVALAAITSGLDVDVHVGTVGAPGETGPSGEPWCFTIHLARGS